MTSVAPRRGRAVDMIWQPDQPPPRGQIRTDGTTYAIHLPLSITDPTPWHIVSDDYVLMRTVTHAVVHSPSWRALPTLLEMVLGARPGPALTPTGASAAGSALDEARLFFPGDSCPDDVAAVLTPDSRIWEAREWRAEDASITWDDLLLAFRGAVEVPVQQLMGVAYAHQQRRLAAVSSAEDDPR